MAECSNSSPIFCLNRTYQVRVSSTLSMTEKLDSGTTQGIILSQKPFSIYHISLRFVC